MNKTDVTKIFKSVGRKVSKRSPEILISMGIASAFTSVVLAVKATPKAMVLIEEEKKQRNQRSQRDGDGKSEELKKIDVVKVAWKPYIPAAITFGFSMACLIGANSKYARRNAALVTACKLSETALSEYHEKVVETIGEKKEKAVRDKIAKDKIEQNPVSETNVVVLGKGDTLFYEPLSGRYFSSEVETIRSVVNDLNYNMGYGCENYISVNQLYDAIGLAHTQMGEMMGWNISNGLLDITFSAQIADNGRPCLALMYDKAPQYDYDMFY